MSDLRKWAQDQRDYIRFEDGVPIFFKYLGHKIGISRFEKDAEVVEYHVEIDGTEKSFESRSAALADSMADIEINQWIKVTRTGSGSKTKYLVEKLDDPNGEQKFDGSLEDEPTIKKRHGEVIH